jgi:23S rRNA (uridine2552-2'-O)-methyltransferase
MKRSRTSGAWMREHVSDAYVQQARALGYRSRAGFKLMEIDDRDRLLRAGMVVVDLGAAPGSWSQVAVERTRPGGLVIGLDLLPVEPLAGAVFLQGDFRDQPALEALQQALAGRRVDLVLSDMAPNISGIGVTDQARAEHLAELALDFAVAHLRPEGVLLMKTFHGGGFEALRRRMGEAFETVLVRKPKASRERSSEVYLLGRRPG